MHLPGVSVNKQTNKQTKWSVNRSIK